MKREGGMDEERRDGRTTRGGGMDEERRRDGQGEEEGWMKRRRDG